jgi:hypothetical protein
VAVGVEAEDLLRAKFAVLLPHLDERAQRLYLGSEARSLGHGGVAAVARAAGSATKVPVTLAEKLSNSWAVQLTPNPAGATSSYLNGVACPSVKVCEAVGYNYGGSPGLGFVSLAEGWDGTSWEVQPTQVPVDATGSVLSGVACSSKTDCEAVGHYFLASGSSESFAERWNGTKWAGQATPDPAGATSTQLNGVACSPTADFCQAVGLYTS